MSKLSDRFKKNEEQQVVVEECPLLEELLEKVNSVPYWNEYTVEKQRELVGFFVANSDVDDKETVCKTLEDYVIAFGPLQKLIDNERVSAVFVKDVNSVYIEIDGREFNTEIGLSDNMFQYILNYVKYLREESAFEGWAVDISNGVNITIRKI